MKTTQQLEEELKYLKKEKKRMDFEDIVKAERTELIKRKYKGIKTLFRFFVK